VYGFKRVSCCAPPFQRLRTRKLTLRRLCLAATAAAAESSAGCELNMSRAGWAHTRGHDCLRALGFYNVELELREAAALVAEDNVLSDDVFVRDACSRPRRAEAASR
jgi:hypothetical protein